MPIADFGLLQADLDGAILQQARRRLAGFDRLQQLVAALGTAGHAEGDDVLQPGRRVLQRLHQGGVCLGMIGAGESCGDLLADCQRLLFI